MEGEAEVGKRDGRARLGLAHQDVDRFDIAVDRSDRMDSAQGGEQLVTDAREVGGSEKLSTQRESKVPAAAQAQDDKPLLRNGVEQGNDIGAPHTGEGPGLGEKSGFNDAARPTSTVSEQTLDSDIPPGSAIVGLVDHGMAPTSEWAAEVVAFEVEVAGELDVGKSIEDDEAAVIRMGRKPPLLQLADACPPPAKRPAVVDIDGEHSFVVSERIGLFPALVQDIGEQHMDLCVCTTDLETGLLNLGQGEQGPGDLDAEWCIEGVEEFPREQHGPIGMRPLAQIGGQCHQGSAQKSRVTEAPELTLEQVVGQPAGEVAGKVRQSRVLAREGCTGREALQDQVEGLIEGSCVASDRCRSRIDNQISHAEVSRSVYTSTWIEGVVGSCSRSRAASASGTTKERRGSSVCS